MSTLRSLPQYGRSLPPFHPLDEMPFMRMSPTGRVFWWPPMADTFQQNYSIGRCFGWEAVAYIREYEADHTLGTLGNIARDMVRSGPDGNNDGMVCGFMNSIADAVVGRSRL